MYGPFGVSCVQRTLSYEGYTESKYTSLVFVRLRSAPSRACAARCPDVAMTQFYMGHQLKGSRDLISHQGWLEPCNKCTAEKSVTRSLTYTSLSVRATRDQSIVHCTTSLNERRTYRQHHELQCECSSRVLQTTPHIVGLIPSVPGHELTGHNTLHVGALSPFLMATSRDSPVIWDVSKSHVQHSQQGSNHQASTSCAFSLSFVSHQQTWTFARAVSNSCE